MPYFPGSLTHGEIPNNYVRQVLEDNDSSIVPPEVLANVLHENFRRRVNEANGTLSGDPEFSSLFDEDGRFMSDGEDDMVNYSIFRQVDSSSSASAAARLELFIDNPYSAGKMSAYEIYARTRFNERDLYDVSFATSCLKIVAASRGIGVNYDVERSEPKLTRIVEDDKKRKFGVVTTKAAVGSLILGSEDFVTLKSRQAGAIPFDNLQSKEQDLLYSLYKHPRRKGRTDKLMEDRKKLGELIEDNPELALPIVESIYVARN